MARPDFKIRFIHKDDFQSSHDYVGANSGLVAKTYTGSDIFDPKFPTPDSSIDASGGTFQSEPRPYQAKLKLIVDSWLQENVIDSGTTYRGLNEHVIRVYRIADSVETLLFTGVVSKYTPSTVRRKTIELLCYDFIYLLQKAKDEPITLGLEEDAGEIVSIKRFFTSDPNTGHAVAATQFFVYEDDFVIPEIGKFVKVYFDDSPFYFLDALIEVIGTGEDFFWGRVIDTDMTEGQLVTKSGYYEIFHNVELENVSNFFDRVKDELENYYFQSTGKINLNQNYLPHSLVEYGTADGQTNPDIFDTDYAVDFPSNVSLRREIGFFIEDGKIKLMIFVYYYTFFTGGLGWWAKIILRIIEFSDSLIHFPYEVDTIMEGSQATFHNPGDNNPIWQEFIAEHPQWDTLTSTKTDSAGNVYSLVDSNETVRFIGSLFLEDLSYVYDNYTIKDPLEAILYLNSLTYHCDNKGDLNIENKLKIQDQEIITVGNSELIANSRTIPSSTDIHFDREPPDLSFIFGGGNDANARYLNIDQVVGSVEFLTYLLFHDSDRGFEAELDLVGAASEIQGLVKGSLILVADQVWYIYEIRRDELLKKRKKFKVWLVDQWFERSEGDLVIVSGEAQALPVPVGVPVMAGNNFLVDSQGNIIVEEIKK